MGRSVKGDYIEVIVNEINNFVYDIVARRIFADLSKLNPQILSSLTIYEEIGTEVFGNSRVVEIIGCSEVTATSYLKRMEDELKILLPVEGMGKGKYKFSKV